MNKTVSIVVPVYHAQDFIKSTMDCVLAQSYKDWELFMVVDDPQDATIAVIENYIAQKQENRIHVLVQEINKGAAQARNRGVQEATGRYIAYLDADDLWKADKLEKMVAFLEEKKVAFGFSGYEFADENGIGLGKVVNVPETLEYREALRNTTIFTSTVMFDTEKIDKQLLNMPDVKSEDTALWWKILRSGYKAYGLDENLVYYRRPSVSLSSNKFIAIKRIWNLYRNVEKLSLPYSCYNFCFWAVRAVLRRV